MNELFPFLIVGVFIFFVFGFYWTFLSLAKRRRLKQRIDHWGEPHLPEDKVEEMKPRERVTEKLGKPLNDFSRIAKWQKQLYKANVLMTPGEFFIIRFIFTLVPLFLLFALGVHWLFYGLAAVVGFWSPIAWLNHKVNKRMQRASQQLSEALGTMSNSMRAGFSFMQAIKLIAEEYPDPLGPEFKKTLKDIQYGVSIEEAFGQLAERLPDRELDMTVKAMLVQRTAGGNLADLFETIQETVIGRLQIKDEVKTLTAQGRLSTWIITALPIALGVYLAAFNEEYFSPLYSHPLGILLMILGAMGIFIGWISLRRIVRIEV